MNDNSRRAQRVLHEAIQILEQLTQGLASTICSWDRFKEHDLAYFDLDNGPRATQQKTTIRNIEADIRDLRLLQVSLQHQRESLKGLTSRVSFTLSLP
jgi:hypothetical protein